MAGLTFVNQVGAVEGMNQAAPGTLIPDTFVRWSQDVLFDRAGLLRRRGPFEKFKMYNNNGTENTDGLFSYAISGVDDERVLAVLSTYDPTGSERIGMLVDSYDQTTNTRETILRVFDNTFKYLGYEVLPFDVAPLSIVSAKPALGGGLWISIADDPADATSHYQFFWRGGYNDTAGLVTKNSCVFTIDTSGVTGFDVEHSSYSTTITVPNVTGLSVGQFVFTSVTVSGNTVYRYIGVISDIVDSTHITLEKRPYMWSDVIDNNHSITYNIASSAGAGGTPNYVTFRINGPTKVLFTQGDFITVSGHSVAGYNTDHEITAVPVETYSSGVLQYTTITTNTVRISDGTGGTMRMKNDIQSTSLTQNLVFTSIRPYIHVHGRGLLTTTTDSVTLNSGTIGTSGEGHWLSAKVTNWNVYRASDNAYYGKVKSVSTNSSAVFWSDPGITTSGDEYIMKPITDIRLTGSSNDYKVFNRSADTFAGLYTAVYAGYQWYGNFGKDDENTNRVVFSAFHNCEAVDLSLDAADSIIFPGKSKFRGLGASSAGLLVFLEDRTYILRGNDRTNFSVEQLVPEGCLCASSIVEYGGGVFWAGKSGIMFFDGASVRNLTKDNLGLYYTDSLDVFNPEQDRVIGFMHKNNLIMHYTSWKSPFDPIRYEPIYAADWQNTEGIADRGWDEFDSDFEYDDFFTQNNTPIFWDQKKLNNPEESASTGKAIKWNDGSNWEATTSLNKWGPLRKNTSITFCVYLPTNALTTLSNVDFRGVTSIETLYGLKTIVGVNSVETISSVDKLRARLIDIHPVFDTNTNGDDAFLVEKINIPYTDLIMGPDFYLQTKHFTVGDPVLRKWFQRIMISMLLYDGAIRMDLVDDDDNDSVDINKKKHKYWELFVEKGYDWAYLTDVQFPKIVSPNKASWQNIEGTVTDWDELFTADFNRYVKRISWRKSSIGFRLYQLNEYKKPFNGVVTKPNRVEIQGFSIGFKPLRQGRI